MMNRKTSGTRTEALSAISSIHRALRQPKGTIRMSNSGNIGHSVFYALFGAHIGQRQSSYTLSRQHFDSCCNYFGLNPLFNRPEGLVAFGSVVHLLASYGVLKIDPDLFLSDVDVFVGEKMAAAIRQNSLAGFVNGAVGCGLYFVNRGQARFSPEIEKLIQALESSVRPANAGFCWPPYGQPLPDLSLGHGQSSVILLLADAVDQGMVPPARVYPLVEGSAGFIVKYLDIASNGSCDFPEGLLGAGYALFRAGTTFGEVFWKEKGLDILKGCAEHDPSGPFIHGGSGGTALLMERIFRITSDPFFEDAAGYHASSLFTHHASSPCHATSGVSQEEYPGVAFSHDMAGVGATVIRFHVGPKAGFDRLVWLI